MAINSASGSVLAEEGIGRAADLSEVAPGLTFAKSGSNTPIYTIRGVGFNTRNLSATSPVGIDVDEVAYAYPYLANGPFFDIDRVEVLKGPQGTLFGRNTTGGLINMTTVRPGSRPDGYLEGSFGSYWSYGLEGALGGPITPTLGLRLAFDVDGRMEGWQHSLTRSATLGRAAEQAGRVSLDWNPVPVFSSELTVGGWRNRSDTEAPQAISLRADYPQLLPAAIGDDVLAHPHAGDADWDPRSAGKPPFRAADSLLTVAERLRLELGDHARLISVTGYNRLHRRDFDDMDGTRYEFNGYQSAGRISSFSEELRLDGDLPGLKYILGAYYAHDRLSDREVGWVDDATTILALRYLALSLPQDSYTPAQILGGFRNFQDRNQQTSRTASVFANLRWSPTDTVELAGGTRWSRDHLGYRGCSYDDTGNAAPIWNTAIAFLTGSPALVSPGSCLTYTPGYAAHVAPEFVSHLDQDNLAFRTSLSWRPTNRLLVYATLSRGTKSGAYPLIPANIDTQLTPARQEKVLAYEGGAKLTSPGGALQLRAAAFFYDYRDKQTYGAIPDPVFVTLNRIINIPKSRVYGAEAELVWRATPDLTLNLAGTALSSRILRYAGYNLAGQPEDFAGRAFTFTPTAQATASALYDHPVSGTLALTGAAHLSCQSHAWGDLENSAPYRLRAYALVNAEVGVRTLDGRWRAALWTENLTNTYYWTYTGYERETVYRLPGLPRTVGVRVTRALR